MTSRRRPPGRPVVVALAIIGTLGAAVAVAVVAVFGSGTADADPDSPDVAAAYDRTAPIARQTLADSALASAEVATGQLRVLAEGGWDDCTVGHDSWKRRDPFALQCALGTLIIAAADGDTFADDMLAFHDRLVADGWVDTTPDATTPDQDIADRIDGYWRPRDGSIPTGANDDRYGPDDLPAARYERTDGLQHLPRPGSWRLQIRWIDATTTSDYGLGDPDLLVDPDGNPVDLTTLRDNLDAGEYGLVVSLDGVYHRHPGS